MFIFLYGDDNFRSRQKLNEIIRQYRERQGDSVNYISFDFDTDNPKDIKAKIDTQSLFPEKKFIVCKNIFGKKENQEYFLDFLNKKNKLRDDKDIVLLFYESSKPDEKSEFFKFLKENSKFQEFKALNQASINQWIKKEIESRGGSCDFSVVIKLGEVFGNDLWEISNAIDKLIAFDEKINQKNINLLCKSSEMLNIFELLDSIGMKNRKKSLSLLEKYFNEGEKETYILAMILGQFRNLVKISGLKLKSQLEISKIAGIHPFVVKKSLEKLRHFDKEKIKNIYSKIAEADFNIKTGRQDPKIQLNLLVLESTK